MDNAIFYRYLIEALRFKIRPENTNRPDFKLPGSPYNLKYGGVSGIFWYARRVFPPLYRTGYPNTPEGDLGFAKNFITQLDIRHDPALQKYLNPQNPPIIDPQLQQQLSQNPTPATTNTQPQATTAPVSASSIPTLPIPSAPVPTPPIAAAAEVVRRTEIPEGVKRAAAGVSSDVKVFALRNFGKYLTAENGGRLIATGLGALTGGIASGGNPLAIGLGAAGTGYALPEFFKKGGGQTLLNFGGRTINFGAGFSNNLTRRADTITRTFKGGKKMLLILLAVLGLVIPLLMGAASVPNSPTGNGSGDSLIGCKFTRAGVSKPVGSSILLSIFQEVAAKSGVPTAVLASVAMHETPDFVANATNSHDAFTNKGFSGVECKPHFATSPTGALGLMQIEPPTTILPTALPGAYSQDGVSTGLSFQGKSLAALTMMDFCDVKSSVYLGAGVLIGKNNNTPPTTGEAIKKAACGYYGTCDYGAGNYGDEAAADWANCQASSQPGTNPLPAGPIGFSVSCPLANSYKVSCGTAANPVNSCGHGGVSYAATCDPTYYVCNGARYSEALYHAIDVMPSTTTKITLPFINGTESVIWTRVDSQPIAIGGGSWGYRIDYRASYKGHDIYLDLTHLNPGIDTSPTLKSGDMVSTVFADIGHLHTGLQVDGRWIEPQQEANMCK